MSEENAKMSSDDFEKFVKKSLGEEISFGTLELGRWSMRNYALNKAMGGGVPSSRITTFVGESSSGKSTAGIKLAAEVASTHRKTGKPCEPSDENSCNVLFIDQEGSLLEGWAEVHGYHPNDFGNKVMSFKKGPDAIDTITAAINSGIFSLIVVDSIDTIICDEENDKSASDMVVGKKAIMMNRAFRSWTANLNCEGKKYDKWWQRPTMFCVNQIRHGIGTYAEESYPGGRGQYYYSSVFARMGKGKHDNDKKRGQEVNFGIYQGFIKKNKVEIPNAPFLFQMALRDLPNKGLGIGDIDNIPNIYSDAKPLMEKKDDGYHLFGHVFRIQKDLEDQMYSEPALEREIMQKVIQSLSNQVE